MCCVDGPHFRLFLRPFDTLFVHGPLHWAYARSAAPRQHAQVTEKEIGRAFCGRSVSCLP